MPPWADQPLRTAPLVFFDLETTGLRPDRGVEGTTRRLAGRTLRDDDVIPDMIDRIKALIDRPDDAKADA